MIFLSPRRRPYPATALLLGWIVFGNALQMNAASPGWWSERGILETNRPLDDFAAVNQGQVKNLAKAAIGEMDAKLPGGAGEALHALSAGWSVPNPLRDDYATVNQGQLKALAKLFYDRLLEAGYATTYPWTLATTDDDNYAAANIGQAKYLFSFDLSTMVPPSAPSHLTATEQQDGSIQLSWTDNSDNETGFTLQRSDDNGQTWITVGTVGANVTSYTVAGNQAGTAGTSLFRSSGNNNGGSVSSSSSSSSPITGEDWDQDGLVNEVEAEIGTNPRNPDSDSDGLADGEEAVPKNGDMKMLAAPETNYAVIDLGNDPYEYAAGLSDKGQALLIKYNFSSGQYENDLWNNGTRTRIDNGLGLLGLLQDGTILRPGATQSGLPFETQELKATGGDGSSLTNKYFRDAWLGNPNETNQWQSPLQFPTAVMGEAAKGVLEQEYASARGLLSNWVSLPFNDGYKSAGSKLIRFNDAYFRIFAGKAQSYAYNTDEHDAGAAVTGWLDASGNSTCFGWYWAAGHNPPVTGCTIRKREVSSLLVNSDGFCAALVSEEANYFFIPFYHAFPEILPRADLHLGAVAHPSVYLGGNNWKEIPGCHMLSDLNVKKTDEGPYILGRDENGPALWCYKQGQFSKLSLPIPGVGGNEYVIGRALSNSLVIPAGDKIWRNSRVHSVAELTGNLPNSSQPPVWSQFSMSLVSPANNLLLGNATKNGERHRVLLLPMELAVDANRDGFIKFAGNYSDPAVAGKPTDTTTEDKPFKFWINNDHDKDTGGEEHDENPTSSTDSTNVIISCERDLEDFAPLEIYLGGLLDAVKSGTIRVGLKFVNATGDPAIRIYTNADQAQDGAYNYLKDESTAAAQIIAPCGIATQTYTGAVVAINKYNTFILPTNFWTNLSETNPKKSLVFEGYSAGKGQLVFEFYKQDGTTKIGEGPGVWLELKKFTDFYEHWTCGDTDARGATVAATATHPSDNSFEYGPGQDGLSVPGAPTYNDYVLFVHGWRMQPWERRAFAETAFKRMYHQGYKGKFGFFSWPTEWIDLDSSIITTTKNALSDPQHYDRSEVQARKSGNGPLHGLLVNLNSRFGTAHVNVFAHSMGNVVVSEALRAHAATPLINIYAACQSAEVAHAFDQNAASNTNGTPVPNLYRYNPSNPRVNQLSTEGDNYHKGISSRALNKFVNFLNLGDNALSSWDLNQWLKPDEGWYLTDTEYKYICWFVTFPQGGQQVNGFRDAYYEDPPGITGNNVEHEIFWPADRFVILAHTIAARSRAAGATSGMGGEFDSQVNLGASPYSFGNGPFSHSAEFLSTFTKRRTFYYQLLKSFRLEPDEL